MKPRNKSNWDPFHIELSLAYTANLPTKGSLFAYYPQRRQK